MCMIHFHKHLVTVYVYSGQSIPPRNPAHIFPPYTAPPMGSGAPPFTPAAAPPPFVAAENDQAPPPPFPLTGKASTTSATGRPVRQVKKPVRYEA